MADNNFKQQDNLGQDNLGQDNLGQDNLGQNQAPREDNKKIIQEVKRSYVLEASQIISSCFFHHCFDPLDHYIGGMWI